MRLEQFAYAVAVAEEESFSRAGDRLGVAQPSLSRQIRLLEQQLGLRLFHRGPGHPTVELTPDGAAILPFLRRVLADVEAITAEARALAGTDTGHLRLGATPSLTTSLLPEVLARFRDRHPGLVLSIVEAGSRDLVSSVADGGVDLAFVVLPVDQSQVATQALFDERLVLAVPRSHPLAGSRQVRLADLASMPMVVFRPGYDLREVTLDAFRRAGLTPRVALEGGEMDGVLAFVAAGLGAAIVPGLVLEANPELVGLPFADGDLSRTVALAYRSDRPLPRAAAALLAQVTAEPWEADPRMGGRIRVTGRGATPGRPA